MKRFIVILLTAAMLMGILGGCGGNETPDKLQNATAEATEPPRELSEHKYHQAAAAFAGGSGTEADPFQISEPGHLVLLSDMLKKEAEEINFDMTYVEGHFVLTADISLNDAADFESWSTDAPEYGWEPIGVSGAYFAGVLDGNGHKITGMFIDADNASAVKAYYGLFSQLEGTVKNLMVEDSYICVSGSSAQVGTVAGYTYQAAIENCSADTNISLYGAATAGGIAGQGGIITNCSFSGTITQLDDGVSQIGGIAGSIGSIAEETADSIMGCTFSGTLTGKGHTGGIVGYGENVKNCVNKGTVSGDTAGGISGRAYVAGTDLEIKNLEYTIDGCTNEGTVTGTAMAGGIVGWMGNDESDISMAVINCANKGQAACDESVAGIIGQLSVERADSVKVENCVNHANITGKGTAGGIIGQLAGGALHQEGAVTISGCKNLGSVISEDQYSAGIVAYLFVMGKEVDMQLTLENCSNEGTIQSAGFSGGVIGFSNVGFNASISADSMEISDDTRVSLHGCTNSGSITGTTSNAAVGGIAGNWGLGGIQADITQCVNTGAVAIDFTLTDQQIEELQGSDWTEFYQIAGGIVGRIGDGLKLTTAEAEERNPDNVNAGNALLVITGCSNTGTVSAPDYSFILNQWKKPLYRNYLGGVVGQCSAIDGYSFRVENCTYSGAERGLGDTEFSDLGTKKA